MSRIDDLIEQLCPDGVEYKRLGDIALVGTGSHDTKDAVPNGKYVFYARGREPLRLDSYDFDEIAIITSGDGNVGKVFHFVSGKYALHQRAYRIVPQSDVLPRYLYYCFVVEFGRYLEQILVSSTVKSLRRPMFLKYPVPIPPLEVQREIVRILDQFTQLEAELEAELEARRKQYEHYRNQLLTFSNDVPLMLLGDVARIKNGKDHKSLGEGDIPVYGSGGIMRCVDVALAEGPSVLIPRKGSLGNLFYVEGPFWVVDTIFRTEIDISLMEPKFFYYQLKIMALGELNYAGGVPSQTQTVLNKIQIPIPPLEEQRRIVEILDTFDALVNDLSTGLPAELEARRKQYEYYRKKLLTFQEKNA